MRKTIVYYEIVRFVNNVPCFMSVTKDEELAKAVAKDRYCTYLKKEVEIEDAPYEETYCEDCQCYMESENSNIVLAVYPPRYTVRCPKCKKEKTIYQSVNFYDRILS